jgi:hypothetical protein
LEETGKRQAFLQTGGSKTENETGIKACTRSNFPAQNHNALLHGIKEKSANEVKLGYIYV